MIKLMIKCSSCRLWIGHALDMAGHPWKPLPDGSPEDSRQYEAVSCEHFLSNLAGDTNRDTMMSMVKRISTCHILPPWQRISTFLIAQYCPVQCNEKGLRVATSITR